MSGRWFRFYDETLNDPKCLKLSDKTFRVWVGLLCAASKNGGKLPLFDDMVIMLRMKPDKLQPEIEKLIAAELIDHDDNGMRPHNWNKRQYKSDVSTERVKRFRNGGRNVSETPPDTEQIQTTEQIRLSGTRFEEIGKKKSWPTHGTISKRRGTIWLQKGSTDFDAYAEDYRKKNRIDPPIDDNGGHWFNIKGENAA